MTDLTVKMPEDDAATLYAAMLVCTMSGGGSPENSVLMRFAEQIGTNAVSVAMARLPRVSQICINEWLHHNEFFDGVPEAAEIIKRSMNQDVHEHVHA